MTRRADRSDTPRRAARRAFGNQPANVATTSINWGDLDDPSPVGAFFGSIGDSLTATGNGIRAVGDFLAARLHPNAAQSQDPIDAAGNTLVGSLIEFPFDVVGGVVDVPGLFVGVTQGAVRFADDFSTFR